jgi:hypothetical protein
MSGLMIGILLSRPVFGWRGSYALDAVATAGAVIVLYHVFPRRTPPIQMQKYGALIASLWELLVKEPVLRRRADWHLLDGRSAPTGPASISAWPDRDRAIHLGRRRRRCRGPHCWMGRRSWLERTGHAARSWGNRRCRDFGWPRGCLLVRFQPDRSAGIVAIALGHERRCPGLRRDRRPDTRPTRGARSRQRSLYRHLLSRRSDRLSFRRYPFGGRLCV